MSESIHSRPVFSYWRGVRTFGVMRKNQYYSVGVRQKRKGRAIARPFVLS